jgi:hypothetical protein
MIVAAKEFTKDVAESRVLGANDSQAQYKVELPSNFGD